jgi:hypothetical protein
MIDDFFQLIHQVENTPPEILMAYFVAMVVIAGLGLLLVSIMSLLMNR